VRAATASKNQECVERGWRAYRKNNGEEVKLRYVLKKISVWVTKAIEIVDVGVSFDKSGYAALPWAIVKFLITVGTNLPGPRNAQSLIIPPVGPNR